jgi:hypothetical protein
MKKSMSYCTLKSRNYSLVLNSQIWANINIVLTLPVRLQSGGVVSVGITPHLPQLPVRTLSQKLPRDLDTIGIFRRARLYDGAHRLRAGLEPLAQLRIFGEQRCRRRVGGEKIRERLEVLCRDDLLDLGMEAGVVGEDGRVLPPVVASSVRHQARQGQRHENEMHDGMHDWDSVGQAATGLSVQLLLTQFSAGGLYDCCVGSGRGIVSRVEQRGFVEGCCHRVHIFTRDETGLVCLPT